jgi:hypothetical protein
MPLFKGEGFHFRTLNPRGFYVLAGIVLYQLQAKAPLQRARQHGMDEMYGRRRYALLQFFSVHRFYPRSVQFVQLAPAQCWLYMDLICFPVTLHGTRFEVGAGVGYVLVKQLLAVMFFGFNSPAPVSIL